MKKRFCFLLIMVLLIISGCSNKKSPSIIGAWRWVSIKYMAGDTIKWAKTENPPEESGIKMWSKDYYTCVYRFKSDTTFDYSYSGGTYKLEGTRYEETILYHDMIQIPDMVGIKEMMILELKDDTLVQTYPVDENGNLLKHYTIIEKLVRLD